ncbi:MAG: DUF2953 domain-containing protein [Ruminococcus sp.]|nr:DUF2953 domain-containing protein [Ruminococcus sp.]
MAIVGLIFKIIGWVLLSVLLLIIVLLHFSAVVRVRVGRDGLAYTVKYLGFTIMPRKKKPPKPDADEDKPSEVYDEIDDEIAELDLEDDDLEKEIEDFGLEDKETASDSKAEDKKEDTQLVKEEPSEKRSEAEDKPIKKKEKAKKQKSEKSDNKEKGGGLRAKIDGLKQKYYMIKPYVPFTWKMFKKLLKTVRIRIDDVRLIVGREDAHEAAIYYGASQAAISNLLTMLGGMFTLKVRRCDVTCQFAKNCIDGKADISVRVRPSAAIWIVLLIGFNAAFIWIRQKLAARRAAKTAAEKA